MLAKNCDIILIGQLNTFNDTIRWQLLSKVQQKATYHILYYVSHTEFPKVVPGETSELRCPIQTRC